MAVAVQMPRQGQSVETCIITQWMKKKGDPVEEGDILFSYETDKAAFDEEAKSSGILLEIFYQEGDEVPVLENVAVIGNAGEDISEFAATGSEPAGKSEEAPAQASGPAPESTPVVAASNTATDLRVRISPRARKMAEKLGITVNSLNGSGPNGRIIAADIEKASVAAPAGTVSATPVSPTPAPVPVAKAAHVFEGEYNDQPISNIRKLIATNMIQSLQQSAQLTHHTSADARRILALRKAIKEGKDKRFPAGTTLNDMVCYAIVQVLKVHPEMNAHFLGDKLRSFAGVHMGLAVDTPRGLMVPVLRNADRYNLGGLGSSLKELAEGCKNGTVDPDLLSPHAGSFTVSNLGAFGVEIFTPVLNVPQCGIMGVNTITHRPTDLGDGTIAFVPHIGISLTYDHRAIDGAPASRFLQEVSQYISNFNPEA